MDNNGRELSWDDQIEQDSQEFILLAEGDYDFKIEKYERARSQEVENFHRVIWQKCIL